MTSLSATTTETRSTLPKLWNRTHATARLEEEMNRAARESSGQFSILLVQFDGLSEIADRLGYAFGDDMWRRALGVLIQDIRPDDLCCRLGCDEFLLILPARGQSECRSMAERLTQRWNPGVGTRESNIEMSVGVAAFPAHGLSVRGLLSAADEDMQASRFRHEMLRSQQDAFQAA